MSISTTTRLSPALQTVAERCRGLRVPLAILDDQGAVVELLGRGHQLGEKLMTTALYRASVVEAVEPDLSEPIELWPGCWLLALPIRTRRQCQGYLAVTFVTERFLDTEQYRLACDQARLDALSAADQARRQDLMSDAEVRRVAALLYWMAEDIQRQSEHGGEMEVMSTQLGEAYEELSLLYNIAAKMTVTQDRAGFLKEVCVDLQQVLGLRWLTLQLSDAQDRLNELRGWTHRAGDSDLPEAELRVIGRELMQRFGNGGATIINDVTALDMPALRAISRQLLIVPLRREGQTFGVLFGVDKSQTDDLSSVDSKLADSLAQNICIFLDNAILYEDQQDMFMGTLKALVNAIDAKDSYTCGHSERVAMLSRQLAEAAGLDSGTCERVYLSGLVHDVGKIGVPESVLTKPGRLTDGEYEIIKTHPRIGVRILQDIRQMQDLLPGVLNHHERYDGRGYPDGLAGDNIPLFGRLIALADSFDAMSSTRTYREALPPEQVLQEVRDCAGTQFDPHLAEVFCTLDFSRFRDMIDEHRQRQSPLSKALGG